MSGRTLTPRGGNDNVSTPPALAQLIVDHFQPGGLVIEPCCGLDSQPFVRALCHRHAVQHVHGVDNRLPYGSDNGKGRCVQADFLTAACPEGVHWDWLITNPPWSKLQAFLVRSMQVADNVVFLALLPNWLQKAKRDAIRRAGFGIVELLHLPEPRTPDWPRTGFALGAAWIRRGWTGPIHNNLTYAQ